MVRVKLLKERYYEDGNVVYKEGGAFCDREYDAFFINRTNDENMKQYALDMGDGIYYVDECQVEVIKGDVNKEVSDNNNNIIKSSQQKILLVEDGSVDIDDLEDWCGRQNIKLIVYRNGASKPEFLEY